jgi:hypothetical protein
MPIDRLKALLLTKRSRGKWKLHHFLPPHQSGQFHAPTALPPGPDRLGETARGTHWTEGYVGRRTADLAAEYTKKCFVPTGNGTPAVQPAPILTESCWLLQYESPVGRHNLSILQYARTQSTGMWATEIIHRTTDLQMPTQSWRYIYWHNSAKAIPVIGHEGLYGCEMLRVPSCLDNLLADGGEVVSLTHRVRSTPQKHYFSASGTHFC